MDKELFDYIAERADILATTGASKQETKDAATAWQTAVVNADDAAIEEATQKLVDFLEGRPKAIDGVIAFAQGPAVEMLGKETADQMLEAQLKHKEQGEKYCDCAACTAAVEILAKYGRA